MIFDEVRRLRAIWRELYLENMRWNERHTDINIPNNELVERTSVAWRAYNDANSEWAKYCLAKAHSRALRHE